MKLIVREGNGGGERLVDIEGPLHLSERGEFFNVIADANGIDHYFTKDGHYDGWGAMVAQPPSDGNQPPSGLRGDLGAPRTPIAGTRDPHASAASSADPLPSEIDPPTLHSLAVYLGWGDYRTERETFDFICEREQMLRMVQAALETHKSDAPTAELALLDRINLLKSAAADPALRTLSQQWREEAVTFGQPRPDGRFDDDYYNGLADCADALDRVCPEIREEQKAKSTTDPV